MKKNYLLCWTLPKKNLGSISFFHVFQLTVIKCFYQVSLYIHQQPRAKYKLHWRSDKETVEKQNKIPVIGISILFETMCKYFTRWPKASLLQGMWHLQPDTWHLTPDTWNATRNMWHMVGGWTSSQNFSSPAFTVWDRECLEDSEQKVDSMNE